MNPVITHDFCSQGWFLTPFGMRPSHDFFTSRNSVGWNSSKSLLERIGKFDVDDVVLVRFPLVETFFLKIYFNHTVKLEFAGDDLVSKGGYFTCYIRLKLPWGFPLVHAIWRNAHYKDSKNRRMTISLFVVATKKGMGLSCPIRPHYRWN